MMKEIKIDSEFITLGQFLKYVDLVSSGGEARDFLNENEISVNGENENRRGKKLYRNDLICINDEQYKIC
ncbi:MAG: S4 domain-containing protein YaaA [Erysipelotrichaceae bacterium]|nr:S4 domain-containing protein YaaA [Erysipelotrichaceae bacterium]